MFSPLLIVALYATQIFRTKTSVRLARLPAVERKGILQVPKNPAQHCYSVTLLEIERREGEERRGSYQEKKEKHTYPPDKCLREF